MWNRSLWILCVFVLNSACHEPVTDPADVVGRYTLNDRNARDMIDVLPNQQYIHTRMSVGKSPMVQRGIWEFEMFGGKTYLAFHEFENWARAELFPPVPRQVGIWPALVERSRSGEIRLTVSKDFGLFYRKEPEERRGRSQTRRGA